ncbi:MAG: hypothetical protein ACYS26_01055 [Planctomycetota bacterium]
MSPKDRDSQAMWEDFEAGETERGLERAEQSAAAAGELKNTELHLGRGLEAHEDWMREALAEVGPGDQLRAAEVLLPAPRRRNLPQLLLMAAALVALIGLGLQFRPGDRGDRAPRFLGADGELIELSLDGARVDLSPVFPDWAPGDRLELTCRAWNPDVANEALPAPLAGLEPGLRLRSPEWTPVAVDLDALPEQFLLELVRERASGAVDEPRWALLSR